MDYKKILFILVWFLVPLLFGIAQAALGLLPLEGPLPSFYMTPTFLVLMLASLVYDRRSFVQLHLSHLVAAKLGASLHGFHLGRPSAVQPMDQLALVAIKGHDSLPPVASRLNQLGHDSLPPVASRLNQLGHDSLPTSQDGIQIESTWT